MESLQQDYDVRCEWGELGLEALAPESAVVIIVDTLSFSTCVEIAVSHGAVIFPYRWNDASAAAFANDREAVLAGPRGGPGFSLSPETYLDVTSGARIVLPSPNGAVLSVGATRPRNLTGGHGAGATLVGCLRNARAAAAEAERIGGPVAILPAGERWPDGSLRPALEDWLGAGAVAASLGGALSPEAVAARAVFEAFRSDLPAALRGSVSGRELIGRGFPADVELASQLDVSDCVPVLTEGSYVASRRP